jgi:predicted dehydrogenase
MCEKPMAKTAAAAREMLAVAKKSGKKLTIGYQNRQRNEMQYMKKLCNDGVLGDIYYGKALAIRRRAVPTWGVFLNEDEQGGGPLIDIGTHALDLTLWAMNNYEVASVTGNVHYKMGKRPNSANAWGPWDPEKYTVEDSAFGLIKMKNGATVILESSWAINLLDPQEACCILAGTEAGLDFKDGMRINGEKYSRLYVDKPDFNSGGVAFYDGIDDNDPAAKEAQQWINAIINDTNPTVLPEQALVVSEILEAIYESHKTGKTIYFN